MTGNTARKILNKTFQSFIQMRGLPYQFENPKKMLWKKDNKFHSLCLNPQPYHFLLNLSTQSQFDKLYFNMLAHTSIPPHSQLILNLGPNLDFGETHAPVEGDPEYSAPEVFMGYVDPLIAYSSEIWHLDMLYDFWSKYPDVTTISNKEIKEYLINKNYESLHFHLDLRILKSTGCPKSKGIPPGILIQCADFLAQTGKLRSLNIAGGHLYPEMARQISSRVIRIIDNKKGNE